MSQRSPISIFIISFNEEDRIGAAIASALKLSSDIVVVDSGSTDRTVEIAASMGARTVFNQWDGYGKQKKFAEGLCQNEWIFNLDADEVIQQDLIDEVLHKFSIVDLDVDAFRTRIVDVIPGDSSPRPFAYAHKYVRVYRRSMGSFSESSVHDTVLLREGARVERLSGEIHHFSIRSLGEQLSKFNVYTDALVADLIRRNRRIAPWRIITEFPLSFLKAYFLRRHFMRGTYGILTAMNYAIFRHIRVAKYYELKRNSLMGASTKSDGNHQ